MTGLMLLKAVYAAVVTWYFSRWLGYMLTGMQEDWRTLRRLLKEMKNK